MSTDYLFARPSFWRGAASVANWPGTVVCNSSRSAEEADRKAAVADWLMVARDMRAGLREYARSFQTN